MRETVFGWPGKSPAEPGGLCHPAACHMLDVAAVAEALLARGTDPLPRRALSALLIALHDLGKIGARFRGMIELGADQGPRRHWEVTEAWLRSEVIEDLLCDRLGGSCHALRPLVGAIAGHHGRPPTAGPDDWDRMIAAAGPEAARDARAFVEICLDLWPEASLAGLESSTAARISWGLSGLAVVADWVGSNTAWFPASPAPASAEAYLAQARGRAPVALAAAGLIAPEATGGPLFDFTLRPMQAAAARIPLREGPMLAFIEDETGAGKTEAALILAQRMLTAGKARGLFFALPTMATADAMFARARQVVRRLFTAPPSLTLAHGRAGLSAEFRDVRAQAAASDDAICGDWIGDNRRRALLADVGIGTVDQALLAVLPTKFATLRGWGLSSKLLIVDEVHELNEPYLAQELAQLLRLHAMQGGSAILLTATLPLAQRAALTRAFEEGAGRAFVEDAAVDYPSLSVPGAGAERQLPQGTSAKGPVAVRRLETAQQALDLITEASGQGAACLWVRNAVDDAIGAVAALRAAGVEADLLHARYALCDRKRIETAMLRCFGKDGQRRRGADGRGRVLVATQVVEASLDLDFDVMVSDLAPVAALIQRAGRLWRHMDRRPAGTRPVPAPVLHVLSPDPGHVADDRWLQGTQERGAWVYPLADQWRTADELFRRGQIVAPSGLRALNEAVHGPDPVAVPPGLQRAEEDQQGKGYAAAGLGRQNAIKIDLGYREGGGGSDDREYPTRLGQPTRTLLLVRRRGVDSCQLRPWAEVDSCQLSPAEMQMLSEVSASAARLARVPLPDQAAPGIAAFTQGWPDWRRAALTVCPVDADGTICEGLRYDAELGLLF